MLLSWKKTLGIALLLCAQVATAQASSPSLNLSTLINPSPPPDTVYFDYRDTFCTDQTVLINNNIYDAAHFFGTEFLPGAAANGADSIIQVQLYFREPSVVQIVQDLCAGDTLWVNDVPYHAQHFFGEETFAHAAINGCDSIVEISLNILPAPHLVITDTLCPGDFRTFNGHRYDFSNPSGTEAFPGAAPNGCDSTISINLTFRDLTLSLGPDQAVALGDEVCLTPELNFTPAAFTWLPAAPCADPPCLSGCFQPAQTATYQLTVTESGGCSLTDEVRISVSGEQRLYFPTAFKPGSESANDHFYLSAGPGVTIVRRLLIADRWGSIVFDQANFAPNDAVAGWDGRWRGDWAPPGVYVFWAELGTIDGRVIQQGGSVTIIR